MIFLHLIQIYDGIKFRMRPVDLRKPDKKTKQKNAYEKRVISVPRMRPFRGKSLPGSQSAARIMTPKCYTNFY